MYCMMFFKECDFFFIFFMILFMLVVFISLYWLCDLYVWGNFLLCIDFVYVEIIILEI